MKKKVGFFDFLDLFLKKNLKKYFEKKWDAYIDLEKNQKKVGDVHRFL